MALSNGISGEFLSPVSTWGQLNPREVTVNHTGGHWLVVVNVRAYYTKKLHYKGLGNRNI